MRAPKPKKARRDKAGTLFARVRPRVLLEAYGSGEVVARFEGQSVGFGMFGAEAGRFVQDLRDGVPLPPVASGKKDNNKEAALLLRRLAVAGVLEYALGSGKAGEDLVVIEPQMADYWPQNAEIKASDTLVLSRFAYLRRRGDDFVVESPLAGALFRLRDPKITGALAALCIPQKWSALTKREGSASLALLSLLLNCGILFKVDAGERRPLRLAEGDSNLVFWDFHDLLFHSRSTEGRHVNPTGGVYPYQNLLPPLPAVRPHWPGKKIDLRNPQEQRAITKIFRERHSIRSFDDGTPITLAELSEFLDGAARDLSGPAVQPGLDDGGHIARPYPSGGASYELELYLAVNACEGLQRGFYHYDASTHALVPIDVPAAALDTVLAGAQSAMGAAARPQIVVTIAARFGRVSWKYSALAYSLILKDVGLLMQTLYLMASDMGLGGCAIGLANIDLFEKMTGIPFYIEGTVGQFALGRPAQR